MKITKQVLKQMIMEELQQEVEQEKPELDYADHTAAINGNVVTFSKDMSTYITPEIFKICLLKYATFLEHGKVLNSTEEFKDVKRKMLAAVSSLLGDTKNLIQRS